MPAANDEIIRQRAYEIWEHEGRQDGNDQEYWYRAENEVGVPPSDLDRNPGIEATAGTWDQGGPEDIEGTNTTEGDVMNDTGIGGSVNPRQRGRTNP
jgi:hypothetical protein